jgi:quinol monooxygenase YgiN
MAQAFSIRRLRVSGCLAELIQRIQSRRAIGVISAHNACASGAVARALRRSIGTLVSGSSVKAFRIVRWAFPRQSFPGYCQNITKRRQEMVKVALLVRLEAKPGREADVESFLNAGLSIVQEEPATTVWFAIRLGPSTFGIFDAFPDESGRQAHLSGQVAAALMTKAPELLAQPPVIENVDVLAAKLPQ